MRSLLLVSAMALYSSVSAFSDTSPLVVLSTAELPKDRVTPSEQLITARKARLILDDLLSACPTDRYIVISQPHVNALDLTTAEDDCAVPNLCRTIKNVNIRTRITISEVFGSVSLHELSMGIKQACIKAERMADIREIALPVLSHGSKAQGLADNDYILRDSLEELLADKSHTIIYLADHEEPMYEAEFAEPVHMDLKRHTSQTKRTSEKKSPSNSMNTNHSLFYKYQFFTPGIFIGLFVTFFLVAILSVGVKALGSLKVPYGAFEKEMGPAAQKKQH